MKAFVAKIALFDAQACLRKGALCCYTIFIWSLFWGNVERPAKCSAFSPFFVDACGVHVCVCVFVYVCVRVCMCVVCVCMCVLYVCVVCARERGCSKRTWIHASETCTT